MFQQPIAIPTARSILTITSGSAGRTTASRQRPDLSSSIAHFLEILYCPLAQCLIQLKGAFYQNVSELSSISGSTDLFLADSHFFMLNIKIEAPIGPRQYKRRYFLDSRTKQI